MAHPPMQPGWIDRPHLRMALGDLQLENGDAIRDCSLSYVVHGELALRDRPVVLALSAVASNHHRLDFLIGSGRALDPDRCTVIAVDAIGNGLSTSPSNSRTQAGMAFPNFTIRDMVTSQAALLDRLGIGQVHAVIGASMGGMQALQWAVSHPARMRRVVAMTPMARTTPWSAAINETSRRALLADPATLSGGRAGWSAWVPLMHLLSGRTPEQVDGQFAGAADTLAWIDERVRWWEAQGFAAIDWIYQSKAYDAHDVGTTPGFGGDTSAALASIHARVLILAAQLDLYNPAHAAREAAAGIAGSRFVEIASAWGHQSAGPSDSDAAIMLNREIGEFLMF
jgi:homoserine O-acetyltransferase